MIRTTEAPEAVNATRSTVIIGIGASAGGLRALKGFFATVAPDTGLAFVVVVHLAVEYESHLADLLQPHASIPVTQVTGVTQVEPNHAYVIPPGRNLTAVDSHLRLAPLPESRIERAPIDHFFRTLAETHDGSSVGVILTGTGNDGAQGIRYIREHGGLAIAQDPEEAEFEGMPRSAIDTGLVDRVLPISQIVRQVLEFASTHPYLPNLERHAGGDETGDGDPLQTVLTLVRLRTGHDFLRYKRSTVARRVSRRMQVLNLARFGDYLELLQTDEREAPALLDDLLINVTSFFRDPEVFRTLESRVIPELFDGKGREDGIRVWSVGCATGEEAYSIGMLLFEDANRRANPPQIQIFATDLHERSLQKGREALFTDTIEAEVSPERLARFFRRENGNYRVNKPLRDLVVFAAHNILRDPPFPRIDLILCRNLLIYLSRDAQRGAIDVFHYALRSGGRVVLGIAETIERSDLFGVDSKEAHIYRRRDVPRSAVRLPFFGAETFPSRRRDAAGAAPAPEVDAGFGALHEKMLRRQSPPSLLVGRDQDVVHLSDRVGRYLDLPGGEPTTNIFKLVREEFRAELRAAIHIAREQGVTWRSRPVAATLHGEPRQVTLQVSVSNDADLAGFALVVFDETSAAAGDAAAKPPVADETAQGPDTELAVTRARMQALIEQFETTQEATRATNEELQSSNEELRSTLEELETSREELQSLNEELQTLNQENRHKVEELSQLSSDLHNLLQATDVATLFLDRNLRILRFTPSVSEIFNVRLSDRGRPLADLTHRLGHSGLINDARRVLQTLVPAEIEVNASDGDTSYLLRTSPYRTIDDRIEGVVITIVDVTALKRAEAALRKSEEQRSLMERHVEAARAEVALRESEARYKTLFESIDQGLAIIEVIFNNDQQPVDYRFLEVNPAFARQTGLSNAVGRTVRELVPSHEAYWFEIFGRIALTGEPERFERPAESLGRWYDMYAFRVGGADERRVAVLFNDILDRKRADAERDRLRARLLRAEEDERRRLARELHDEAGQHLAALGFGLQSLSDVAPPGSEVDRRAAELRTLADTLSRELHALAVRLRPKALDDFGLEAALHAYAEDWSRQSGIRVEVHIGSGVARLPEDAEIGVYRIVQEALTNVVRHSAGTHASVLVERRESQVVAIVEDNGRGFDPTTVALRPVGASGLGLRGIRERAQLLGGSAEIESAPGQGTTVFVRVPMVLAETSDFGSQTRRDNG